MCPIIQVVRTTNKIVKDRELQVMSTLPTYASFRILWNPGALFRIPIIPWTNAVQTVWMACYTLAKELAKADYNFLEEPSFGGDMHIILYFLHRLEEMCEALPVLQLVEEEEDYETDDSRQSSEESVMSME
jgi:hypothetical protein